MRIAFFGTFFPEYSKAGNSSTGIVAALMRHEAVESVRVFAQQSAVKPEGPDWSKMELVPIFEHDGVLSLIRSLIGMLAKSKDCDAYLFNTYLTAYGRSPVANALGLLIPPLTRLLSRKPVVVYMHNFLETQDVESLGYAPTLPVRAAVKGLELFLLLTTRVVVPLRSQQEEINRSLRVRPYQLMFAFAEPIGLEAASVDGQPTGSPRSDGPMRILLLGSWGPQKDLEGAFAALERARDTGAKFVVSLSGGINAQFPEYQSKVDEIVRRYSPDWLQFLGFIRERDVLRTVRAHDLVLLPYRATGGYSGAMTLAAYCGVTIVSSDLPQLRETAASLGISPIFVPEGDISALAVAITGLSREPRNSGPASARIIEEAFVSRLERASNELVGLLRGG